MRRPSGLPRFRIGAGGPEGLPAGAGGQILPVETEETVDDRMASSQFTRRRVTLALRNGRMVRGNVHVIERQSLVLYMATRRFYVNMTEASWGRSGGTPMPHLAVRTDQVYWATTNDPELPVSSHQRPVVQPRWAELIMDDGVTLHVALYIAEEQRLTDYIDAASGFLAVLEARVMATGERLGEAAVNTGAVLAVREIEPPGD